VARLLDDREVFDALRIDPYYRYVAAQFADSAGPLARLVDSVWSHRFCLVHGDFSPKNLLVWPDGLLLVDFETGHYGDPAFDLGFFNTHLVLKAFRAAPRHEPFFAMCEEFWRTYSAALAPRVGPAESVALAQRAVLNLAGCLWARLDGKSPVDYFNDPMRREAVRSLARRVLHDPPRTWGEMLAEGRQAARRATE
jgi:hypothetical protein